MADIRSFFTPKNGKKQAPKKTERSNDKSSDLKGKSKTPPSNKDGKKRRMIIESDSDSEEPLPTKFRKDKEDKTSDDKVKSKKNAEKSMSKSASTSKADVLKPTTADDFFGNPPPVTSGKRKQSASPIKSNGNHTGDLQHESSKPKSSTGTPPKKKKKLEEPLQTKPVKKDKDEIIIPDDDDDIIAPTPPPQAKVKKSSSNKLSQKMKENNEASQDNASKGKELKKKSPAKEKVKLDEKKDDTKKKETEVKKKDKTKKIDKEAKKEEPDTDQTMETQKEKSEKDKTVSTQSTAQVEKEAHTPAERRKSFYQFKHRDGPSALGSKELPKASENCLQGKTFVITGVLDAFERETVEDCIKRYGGKVTKAVSGKTSYVIVGREPGESKMEKAAKHKTKQLDEDGFIELLEKHPPKSTDTPERKAAPEKSHTPNVKSPSSQKTDTPTPKPSTSTTQTPQQRSSMKQADQQKSLTPRALSLGSQSTCGSPYSQSSQNTQSPCASKASSTDNILWVDKYKPTKIKQIVGQSGEKSNVNKLKNWLLKWKENNTPDPSKPKKNFMSGKEDGSIFKAALLSGPPGVGKTTTATIVCQELGFSYVEMNASDTRGKKALSTVIKESLSNVTVDGLLQNENDSGKKHCLIMDEVDGMAGNEDRGGMQELIQLIKKSKIPIICMCNDRNHQKIRSLANYCFDLRFYKPRVEQIKAFALSLACKEGLKIQPQAMEQIVVGANQDIRQVVHNLQMWTATKNTLSYDEAKDNAKNASKNIKMGPFDIVKNLFNHSDASKLNINGKTDLFFNDYSFVPLFIQENYLSVNPREANNNQRSHLELLSKTADAISDGNLVERLIRSDQSWSLLPLQGLFSTVLPSNYMSGYLTGRIDFPQWLGKNSSRGKHDRILQELKTHLSLSANCMKSDINLDYLSCFKTRLGKPLTDTSKDANTVAKEVISFMDSYNLNREDWDSVMEIGKWGNEPDIMSKIPSKVKSAFTRLYNKESHSCPYATQQSVKKTKVKADDAILMKDEDAADNDIGEENEDENEDDITKDPMIKIKKETKAGTSSGKGKKTTSKASAKSTSAAKGKGKAAKKK